MQTLSVLLLVIAASLPTAESFGFWRLNLPEPSTELGFNDSSPASPKANRWPRPQLTPAFRHSDAVAMRLEQRDPVTAGTIGKNTCGLFTLSKETNPEIRTRLCVESDTSCIVQKDYLFCGTNPIVSCLPQSNPLCGSSPSQTRGKDTICCTSTDGFNGECQQFVRKEGTQSKTLWGCRETGLPWDPIVYLYTASSNLLPPVPVITTSSSSSSFSSPAETRTTPVPNSSSTTLDDTPTASVPSGPTLATASSISAPTPEPSNGGGIAAPSSGSQTGAIVGGVLSSVTILAIAGCVATWLVVRRRRATSVRGESRGGGRVSPSPSHELVGDQPCVSPNPKEGEQWDYQPMSPLSPASSSAQRDVFQAPASDSIGSAMKPAELG
ncbi:hypothetical protein CSAL01_02365 [Colletotrichum salicis]|uniref:Uncharacterized protein n=1 Tax=Colletotrichum salicis TaxID=1209931 RepID=A0A135SMN5_9PEZI|nr:hypothetical protein CSAL01_02365 [Colletotrichum salicis]